MKTNKFLLYYWRFRIKNYKNDSRKLLGFELKKYSIGVFGLKDWVFLPASSPSI